MAPSNDVPITRRRLLAVAGASVAIAGCTNEGTGNDDIVDTETGGTTAGGNVTDDDDADGPDGSDQGPLSEAPDTVGLETVLDGLDRPVGMAVPPDDGPWYVVLQGGRIEAVDANEVIVGTALDLTDTVVTSGYEQGLLGLALHPEFSSNRRAFVRYSGPVREDAPDEYTHTFVLSEFTVSADGRQFQPETERTILEIPEPQRNHNAGELVFGPDGYLYVPVGDGGAGGDQGVGHVEDWYDAVDGGNGQDVTENLLGSILRIDVDGGDRYAIPEDNPLVGEPGLDEHYAWGLRNPWGVSWDGEDFYVADVGQASYEEVNRIEAGGNYGWNVKEGTHCFEAEECPDETPSDVRGGESLIEPVIEYPHSGDGITGTSVIGGHVYRGSAVSELQGFYVFGDLDARNRLFVAAPDDGSDWPIGTIQTLGAGLQTLYSIERDADGELYVLGGSSEGSGTVWRITPAE